MQCVPKQAKYLILYYKIAFRPCRAWFSSSTSIGDLIQETGSGYPDFHCTIYVNKLISAFKRMQRKKRREECFAPPSGLSLQPDTATFNV